MIAIRPYIDVLKNFNFTKLWISQVCSQLTNYLLSFAILIKVFRITGSSASVSLIIVSFGLATIFFGAIAGVYADRFDRKWVLTITNFLQALTVVLYFLAGAHIYVLALITFIYSALNQFYIPAEGPSIPNLVPKAQLLIANAYFSFTGSVALICGFALAGPLQVWFGAKSPYTLSVILLLIAGFATLSLPPLKPKAVSEKSKWIKNVWAEFKQGIGHFLENKRLHFPLLGLISIQIVNGMLITVAPAFIQMVLNVNLERGSFLAIAPLGFGILIGALLLGVEEKFISKKQLVISGFIGMGIMVAILSLIGYLEHRIAAYSLVAILIGYFNAHIFAPSHSILQIYALEHIRGRIYGALYVLLHVAATIPTFIIGILADKLSVPAVVMGLGMLLMLFGLMMSVKSRKELLT